MFLIIYNYGKMLLFILLCSSEQFFGNVLKILEKVWSRCSFIAERLTKASFASIFIDFSNYVGHIWNLLTD